jgi:hypothetical protein
MRCSERPAAYGSRDWTARARVTIVRSFARILSVADAVDASSFAAVADQAGTRFCPTTVAAAERCLAADRALREYIAA